MNVSVNNLWGKYGCVAVSISGCVYNLRGEISKAFETGEDIVSMAERSGDIYSKAVAYAALGLSAYHKGLLDMAEKTSWEGIVWSERSDFSWLVANTRFTLGQTLFPPAKVTANLWINLRPRP